MKPAGIGLVVCSILFPSLALFVLSLRLLARQSRNVGLKLEDGLIGAAWMTATAMGIANVIGVYHGHFGEEFASIGTDELTIFTKILFAMQFFHLFSMAFVKYSLLVFYKRVFPTNGFTIAANILLGIVTLWLTAFFFTTLFQAWPIDRNWTGKGVELVNEPKMYLALGIVDVITDLLILALPVPMIVHLHADIKKRLFVGTIFSLGFFCVAASSVRVYYLDLMNHTDIDILNQFGEIVVLYVIWTEVEPCWSIICASLPLLLPLFGHRQSINGIVTTMQTIFAPRSRSSFASLRRINNIEQNLPDTGARSKRYPLVSTERDGEIRSQWDRHKGSGTRRGAYEIELDPRHSIESERNDLTSQLPGDGHRH